MAHTFDTALTSVQTGSRLGDKKRTRPSQEKRPWKAIFDPSGDFLGNVFRGTDLCVYETAYWPDGIIFRNSYTGDYKVWCSKKLRFLGVEFAHLDFSLLAQRELF